MKKKLLVFLLISLLPPKILQAKSHWGLGYFSQYLFEMSSGSDSSKSFLGETQFPLLFKSEISLWGRPSYYSIRLAGLFPAIKTNEGSTKYYNLQVSLGEFSSAGNWFYGLGLQYTMTKGSGGSVVLNNGTGTATFQLPSGSSSSKVFFVEGGYRFPLENMLIDASLQLDNVLGDSRSFSLLVSFLYPLGGI